MSVNDPTDYGNCQSKSLGTISLGTGVPVPPDHLSILQSIVCECVFDQEAAVVGASIRAHQECNQTSRIHCFNTPYFYGRWFPP